MIEITLTNVGFQVAEAPPLKVLRFIDQQSGITVNVPLGEEPAKAMAAQLSGIQIARVITRRQRRTALTQVSCAYRAVSGRPAERARVAVRNRENRYASTSHSASDLRTKSLQIMAFRRAQAGR